MTRNCCRWLVKEVQHQAFGTAAVAHASTKSHQNYRLRPAMSLRYPSLHDAGSRNVTTHSVPAGLGPNSCSRVMFSPSTSGTSTPSIFCIHSGVFCLPFLVMPAATTPVTAQQSSWIRRRHRRRRMLLSERTVVYQISCCLLVRTVHIAPPLLPGRHHHALSMCPSPGPETPTIPWLITHESMHAQLAYLGCSADHHSHQCPALPDDSSTCGQCTQAPHNSCEQPRCCYSQTRRPPCD